MFESIKLGLLVQFKMDISLSRTCQQIRLRWEDIIFGKSIFSFSASVPARVLYKAREFPTALQIQNPDAPAEVTENLMSVLG